MTASIKDVLKIPSVKGEIGVEIEVEADGLPHRDSVSAYWKVEADSSLRGESCEFVLKKPLDLPEVRVALENIENAYKSYGTSVRDTYRAGVHIHINVQDLTPRQLVNYVTLYYMLEEVLLSYCEKNRVGNHFCLRMVDASYLLEMLTRAIKEADLSILNTEDLRYASMNLTSLFKYGSVEFRALESTKNFNKIEVWAGVLKSLKDYAKTVKAPTDLLGQASEQGFEKWAKGVLKPYLTHFLPYIKDSSICEGVRNIQYAIYSHDWNEENFNIFARNSSLFNP